MLQKIFSIKVNGKHEMARLEEVIMGLLGGEHHRCSFLRSAEYIRLRNKALYSRRGCDDATDTSTFSAHSVHLEGLRITLTSTRTVCVYLTDVCVAPSVEPAAGDDGGLAVGRKRRKVESDLPLTHASVNEGNHDSDDASEEPLLLEPRSSAVGCAL